MKRVILVGIAWRIVRKNWPCSSALAYTSRILPLIVSLVAVAAFTVPSFLRFEPRGNDEAISAVAIILAGGGIAILILGAFNALRAWFYTAHCVASWIGKAREQVEKICKELLANAVIENYSYALS